MHRKKQIYIYKPFLVARCDKGKGSKRFKHFQKKKRPQTTSAVTLLAGIIREIIVLSFRSLLLVTMKASASKLCFSARGSSGLKLRACSIRRHMLSVSMASGRNEHQNHTLPMAVALSENRKGSSACPCGGGSEGARRLGPSPPEPCGGGGVGGGTAEAAESMPGQCRLAGGEGYPLRWTDDAGAVSEPPLDCNMQWTEIKNTKSKSISPIKINNRVFFCQKLTDDEERGGELADGMLAFRFPLGSMVSVDSGGACTGSEEKAEKLLMKMKRGLGIN